MRRLSFLLSLVLSAAAAPPNPRELVRQSIANGEKAWKASRQYAFETREIEERLDANGAVKSKEDTVAQVTPIRGVPFERTVQKNGKPLPANEQYRKALAETPSQRAARDAKDLRERAFMKEVPDAFDFKLMGEENLPTGAAWVLQATPHPGYQPRSRYAKMFPSMRGKLWIDKKDIQWVKADAEATDTVSFWFVLARLSKGSHIILEQQRLPEGNWAAKSLQANASARVMLVKNYRFRESITYSKYRKPAETRLSAAR